MLAANVSPTPHSYSLLAAGWHNMKAALTLNRDSDSNISLSAATTRPPCSHTRRSHTSCPFWGRERRIRASMLASRVKRGLLSWQPGCRSTCFKLVKVAYTASSTVSRGTLNCVVSFRTSFQKGDLLSSTAPLQAEGSLGLSV